MGHYLKKNHGTRIPQFTGAVGCSWTHSAIPKHGRSVVERLTAWAVDVARWHGEQWTRRQVVQGVTSEDFGQFLKDRLNPHRPLYLVADDAGRVCHWLGVFELVESGFLHWSEPEAVAKGRTRSKRKAKRPWKGACCIEDPPVILKMWSELGKLVIVDRRNYVPGPLSETLGRSVDDPAGMASRQAGSRMHVDHAHRVATELAGWWRETLGAWYRADSGCWAPTAAALAWQSWRHGLTGNEVLIERNEERDSIERAAYYGGECRAWFVGEGRQAGSGPSGKPRRKGTVDDGPPVGPFYILDCRSFYPSVMRSAWFPSRPTKRTVDTSAALFSALSRSFLPLGSCLIASDDRPYPVRMDGNTTWRTGRFWCALAGPELMEAVRLGHVVRHGITYWYLPARLFTQFVDDWWERRAAADAAGDVGTVGLCKLVLNGLSGKFAQRTGQWSTKTKAAAMIRWGQWSAVAPDGKRLVRYRSLGGRVEVEVERTDAAHAFPAISAFITSYGRLKMETLRSVCPARSVLYQDTDSLIVTGRGMDALERDGLIEPDTLGGLRVVEVSESLTIHGLRDYVTDRGRKSAGIPLAAEHVGGSTFRGLIRPRLGESLCFGPTTETTATEYTMRMNRQYSAGIVGPGGWVSPYRLDDDESLPF